MNISVFLGKACELGGMSYWEFAEKNRELLSPTLIKICRHLTDV